MLEQGNSVQNNLERLSTEELAYIAGFFDGEGYVGIVKSDGLRMRVDITNTQGWILYWLKGLFGGSIFKRNGKSTQKPIYVWTVVSRDAEAFLSKIQPYLMLKGEQAELALEFQGTKGYCRNNMPTTDVIDHRQLLRDRMMVLNRRGAQEINVGRE